MTRARGWAAQKITLRHVSGRFLICSAWPYGGSSEPGPNLLTKLQPDIRTLASYHNHYHLPTTTTTPPLPPFSLPPSSLPPPLFLSTGVNPAAQRQGQTPPLISLPGLSLLPRLSVLTLRLLGAHLGLAELKKKGRVLTFPQHPSQVQRKPSPRSRNCPQNSHSLRVSPIAIIVCVSQVLRSRLFVGSALPP